MKKRLLSISAALLLIGGLTSCVYDRDGEEVVSDQGGDGSLVINITRGAVGQTRSTDFGDPTAVGTNEGKINSMAIAVFNNSTHVLSYYKYIDFEALSEAPKASGFTTTVDTIHNNVATKKIVATDDVVILCNVPDAVLSGVKTVATTTMAAYKAAVATIDQSLIYGGAGTAVTNDHLPMYGTAQVTEPTAGHLTVTVPVLHMVSKVTLEQLDVELAAGASLKPTQVFLYNVPEKLNYVFTTEGDVTTYQPAASLTTWHTGESTVTDGTEKAYLGTQVYTGGDLETLDNTDQWTKQCVLYTMPNTDNTYKTKLIVKGQWSDGTVTDEDTYYAFELRNVVGGAATLAKTFPNRNYRMKLKIMRRGADSPDGTVTTQTATVVSLIASAWDDATQTTTFGENGGTE